MLVSGTSRLLGPCSSHRHSASLLCRLPTLCTIGLTYGLVSLLLGNNLEQCVKIMRYEIESHIPFNLAAELEWLNSRRHRLDQHLAMILCVLPTVGLRQLREPAVSKVFPQGTFLHEHSSVYPPLRKSSPHRKFGAKIIINRLLHANASKSFEPMH